MRTLQFPVQPSASIQAIDAGQWWIKWIPLRKSKDKIILYSLKITIIIMPSELTSDRDGLYWSKDEMRREIMELRRIAGQLSTVLNAFREMEQKSRMRLMASKADEGSNIERAGVKPHPGSNPKATAPHATWG